MSSNSSKSSGSKSKRSFNSNNSSNKKTKNQKNLGVSWGANSLSSFQRSPFPSSQELRAYMLNYGGRYENYFSRRRVTHIICSNLPDSKIKNLRSFSGGLPVVKPNWVVDSVAANKLLSWVPYQLEQVACNQPRLSAFFSPKIILDSYDALRDSSDQVKPESGDMSSVGPRLEDCNKSVCRSTEYRLESSRESDDMIYENTNGQFGKELYTGENDSEVKLEESPTSDAEDIVSTKDELKSSTHQHSASVNSNCLPSSENIGSNRSHSTVGDSNFVENYFKSSRLHFIGTWRNRYRKRFPSSSKGLDNIDSNHCAPDSSPKTPIIHIDMDCFFVSVVIRQRPELKDRPVAVCHSDNPKGTAEISSANYPARDYGVRAGMFVRDAKAHCPHLVILPYNFEAYEEGVSCDEAFLDVTYLEGVDTDMLASTVRRETFETTGCTASAGIAGNMLMARLATRTAKPDGQCNIPPEKVDDYLHELPIKTLPGIGHVLEEKLKKRNVLTCGQLHTIPKDSLQKDFGIKTGQMLWNHGRGIDNRLVGVIQESKSIGAEVNWGVRFRDLKDSHHFLSNLCKEVSLRLQGCAVQGRTFTLKIKKRRKDAQEPVRYMGCGDCENLSHSVKVPVATDDVEVLQRITKQLSGHFSLDVKEIRGIGLQVSKLESIDASKQDKVQIRGGCPHTLKVRTSLHSALSGANDGAPPPKRTPEASLITFSHQLVRRIPVFRRDRYCLKFWVEGAAQTFKSISPGRESGRGRIWSPLGWRRAVVGAVGWRTEGRPHFKGCVDVLFGRAPILYMLNYCEDRGTPRTLGPLCETSLRIQAAVDNHRSSGETSANQVSAPPPLCHLDLGVIESLPPEIFTELNGIYAGKLVDFVANNKRELSATASHERVDGTNNGSERHLSNDMRLRDEIVSEPKHTVVEKQAMPSSVGGSCDVAVLTSELGNTDIMPASLSQVEPSVLQELPQELRANLLEQLPAHRTSDLASSAASDSLAEIPGESIGLREKNLSRSNDLAFNNNLWMGDPPRWAEEFKAGKCMILNILAEMYDKSGSRGNLSVILRGTIMKSQHRLDSSSDCWIQAVYSFSELLRQYVTLKIDSDIEEIYVCFRLLRR
ncbi:hypothetical protein ACLB2K_020806 [Fragaria x ananassa]